MDAQLEAILFGVMPHFVRQNNGFARPRTAGRQAVLDLVAARLDISGEHLRQSEPMQEEKDLARMLVDLEKQKAPVKPLAAGPVSGRLLDDWLRRAARARHLTSQDLRRVMTHSADSQLLAYVEDLRAWGIELKFTDGALSEVARLARREGTGARGLTGILHRVLIDDMYDLPGSYTGELVVDENYMQARLR